MGDSQEAIKAGRRVHKAGRVGDVISRGWGGEQGQVTSAHMIIGTLALSLHETEGDAGDLEQQWDRSASV